MIEGDFLYESGIGAPALLWYKGRENVKYVLTLCCSGMCEMCTRLSDLLSACAAGIRQ